MPRIKLAGWYGDKNPGDEMDVDDVELKALRRDGRVAEVLEPEAEQEEAPQAQPEPATEAPAEPSADAPEAGRRKR